jgi:hypothetical protein
MGQVRTATVPASSAASLEPFVGRWHCEGRQLASPFGPDGPVSADESYEWLDGHRFLVHHFAGTIADHPAACVEILGPRDGRAGLAAHTFYDNGVQNLWDVERDGDAWVLRGSWEAADGAEVPVRCTIRPQADGRRAQVWEYRAAGEATWRTFLDVTARRA